MTLFARLRLGMPRLSVTAQGFPQIECVSTRQNMGFKMLPSRQEAAREIVGSFASGDMNEADTRHRIIDRVLHEVLAWPHDRVRCEQSITTGYADYVLSTPNDKIALIIEAKRQGEYFTLPDSFSRAKDSRYVPLNALLTDRGTKEAINQVRNYCLSEGCPYAAVTNGNQWIFFRTFASNQKWERTSAFVVTRLDYFAEQFAGATNVLGFSAVTEGNALRALIDGPTTGPKKELLYAKEKVASYNVPVSSNDLARFLRPLADSYFGVIPEDNEEFMRECYVRELDDEPRQKAVTTLIEDQLTPYFSGFRIEQLEDDDQGGQLTEKLTKSVRRQRTGQVLVLFGGKGSGKSTFIRRILLHSPPTYIRKHAKIVIIDLLAKPSSKEQVTEHIWSRLVSELDSDRVLDASRETVLKLCKDRYQVALNQNLQGLEQSSIEFNTRLNDLVQEWKRDTPYIAAKLGEYWHRKHQGIVVVIDNTDQYSSELQDFTFVTAQEISAAIGSLTVISMREERFYNSKIRGVLDAFQNSGFHISSPAPERVMEKRLLYVSRLLSDGAFDSTLFDGDSESKEEVIQFLKLLLTEFTRENSPLIRFFEACAHGDIRLALDMFRGFLTSGYTNTREMLSRSSWNIAVHQVLKPVMIPDRFFYDETVSAIPNVFALRSPLNGSHFTSIRILRLLQPTAQHGATGYHPAALLRSAFVDDLNMGDDFDRNCDMLLAHGFIEANNRLDAYSEAVDSIKITGYGIYVYRELCRHFTYLDLIASDTGVVDEAFANFLIGAANTDYRMFRDKKKYDRLLGRIEKTRALVRYFCEQEEQELSLYGVEQSYPPLMPLIAADFEKDAARAKASGSKNRSYRDSQ